MSEKLLKFDFDGVLNHIRAMINTSSIPDSGASSAAGEINDSNAVSTRPIDNLPMTYQLKYSGDGVEMALLMLKNLLLSIVTLGIYRAWATTNLRRYTWGHVSFMDDRASYIGTGDELFKGWVKLIGLVIVFLIAVGIVSLVIPFVNIITPIAYMIVFGLATYSGLRYRLSRTVWRQIRFGVDKDKESTREFLKLFLIGSFLTAITLGLYYPWFKNEMRTYLTNRSRFGKNYFSYNGNGSDYAQVFFTSLFLSVITLGIYIPWMIRNLTAYRLEHTQFQDAKFTFALPGHKLLIFSIVAYFGTLMTLGLAIPWIYNWGLRLIVESIQLEGNLDMTRVEASPSEGSALGEEAVLEYDLDLGF